MITKVFYRVCYESFTTKDGTHIELHEPRNVVLDYHVYVTRGAITYIRACSIDEVEQVLNEERGFAA